MSNQYLMGNGAIALGALAAGVNLVAGYPGTPSSEIIETISKFPHDGLHLEWSVNEKAALEVAAAAAYSGARALVTMKQVGLNVASDPLMSLAYVGVKGGMVIVSADDPGPISSQTEQDTRRFAEFARIPVFDPTSPEEAYELIQVAFEYSEKYSTPVLFRPTTRICHAYADIEASVEYTPHPYEGFIKDSKKWVIFPRLSYANHAMIEKRNPVIGDDFSDTSYNSSTVDDTAKKVIVSGGVSYAYAKEILRDKNVKLIKIGTPYPFPEKFILDAIKGAEDILVLEELSPFIEEDLLKIAGKHHLDVNIHGKLTGEVAASGENSCESLAPVIADFLGINTEIEGVDLEGQPTLPIRPPVLCAGCPHRASFYAVKQAMNGKKSYFCGDIGCYTLGNAMPLDMCDTCLCMGAGVTMAQGFNWVDEQMDGASFAFIGDSTFFASGITGVVNAVYNDANVVICVLDNSTTAMTGHQPHPGTGVNMMGQVVDKISIESVLKGIGLSFVETVDPLDHKKAVDTVKRAVEAKGVKAIIFKSPCIAITKSTKCGAISEKCVQCGKCVREIGCPAIIKVDGKVSIDKNLCTGCGLCAQICPTESIDITER